MMHKAWSGMEEASYHIIFRSHPPNSKVTRAEKIDKLGPIWAFPDDNSNLNSRMAMEWHT